jgi:citrate lyase subunit beta/citryl-CoA lyase
MAHQAQAEGWYRSILYLPAHREDAADRLAATTADAVMLDLEDGVPAADKARARRAAADLARREWPPLLFLRVNTADSGEMEQDVAAALEAGIAAVILPKAERAEDVRRLADLIADKETALGVVPGAIRIVALVETCAGALAAPALAGASPRVLTLGIGASDFIADIGDPVSRGEIDPEALSLARRMLVLAARAAGRPGPFDGGRFPPGAPGWREACEHVRRIGFQGKVCFDDEQARAANQLFAAREGEVCRWSLRAQVRAREVDR